MTAGTIAPHRRAELDEVCPCSHERGAHFGAGPCLVTVGASVCPCSTFGEARPARRWYER